MNFPFQDLILFTGSTGSGFPNFLQYNNVRLLTVYIFFICRLTLEERKNKNNALV